MRAGDKIRFNAGFYYGGILKEIKDGWCKVQLPNGEIVNSSINNVKLDTGSRFDCNTFRSAFDGYEMWEETVVKNSF